MLGGMVLDADGTPFPAYLQRSGYYQMHAANELGKRIGKIREMISSMEDENRTQKDAIKDLKDREVALVSELLFILTEE